MDPQFEELLIFFKALADANRLKIVGLLAKQALTVEQLAAILKIGPSTVSHHLSRLSEAGLVAAQAHSYYSVYHLETAQLEDKAHRLLARETLSRVVDDVDAGAFDRKVLADFLLPDGHLKTIPSQQKKLQVLLRHIIQDFDLGVKYSEKQVNIILERYHEDTASLRRELISAKYLAREKDGTVYWKVK